MSEPTEKELFKAIQQGNLAGVKGMLFPQPTKEQMRENEEILKKKAERAYTKWHEDQSEENLRESNYWLSHYEQIRRKNTELGVW